MSDTEFYPCGDDSSFRRSRKRPVNFLECYADDNLYYDDSSDDSDVDNEKEDDNDRGIIGKNDAGLDSTTSTPELQQRPPIYNERQTDESGQAELVKSDLVKSEATLAGTSNSHREEENNRNNENLSSAKEDAIWDGMFQRLKAFRDENGHCLVPPGYGLDTELAMWIQTQRRELADHSATSRKQCGNSETLKTRALRLERLGFEWNAVDPRVLIWETRFKDLLEFVAKNGHTQVPIKWEQNVALANWVSTQRQEYKKFKRGLYSKLDVDRVVLLNSIGFVWEAQRGGPKRQRMQNSSHVPIPKSIENSLIATPSSVDHFRTIAQRSLHLLGTSLKGRPASAIRAALSGMWGTAGTSTPEMEPSALEMMEFHDRHRHVKRRRPYSRALSVVGPTTLGASGRHQNYCSNESEESPKIKRESDSAPSPSMATNGFDTAAIHDEESAPASAALMMQKQLEHASIAGAELTAAQAASAVYGRLGNDDNFASYCTPPFASPILFQQANQFVSKRSTT